MDVDALMDYKRRPSPSPPATSQISGYGITILYFCFWSGAGIATRTRSRAPLGSSPHLTDLIQGIKAPMDTYKFTEA